MEVHCKRCGYTQRDIEIPPEFTPKSGEFYGIHECGDGQIGDLVFV